MGLNGVITTILIGVVTPLKTRFGPTLYMSFLLHIWGVYTPNLETDLNIAHQKKDDSRQGKFSCNESMLGRDVNNPCLAGRAPEMIRSSSGNEFPGKSCKALQPNI